MNEEKTAVDTTEETTTQQPAEETPWGCDGSPSPAEPAEVSSEPEESAENAQDPEESEQEQACKDTQSENAYRVSMDSSVFNGMKSDIDKSLRRLLAAMEQKSSEKATLSVKLDIELDDYGSGGPVVPRFTHKVTTSITIKDSCDGYTGGSDYELVYDKDTGDYLMKPISNGQRSLFEEKEATEDEIPDPTEDKAYAASQQENSEQMEIPEDGRISAGGEGDAEAEE